MKRAQLILFSLILICLLSTPVKSQYELLYECLHGSFTCSGDLDWCMGLGGLGFTVDTTWKWCPGGFGGCGSASGGANCSRTSCISLDYECGLQYGPGQGYTRIYCNTCTQETELDDYICNACPGQTCS